MAKWVLFISGGYQIIEINLNLLFQDDKGQYVYKTSSYQYSTSGQNNSYGSNNNNSSQNIDQLDALLDDLKNERQMTLTRDRG